MRLHEWGMQPGHRLAAMLTASVAMFRTGHAVATLHGFIRRGRGEAVKRVQRQSHSQQSHANYFGKPHHPDYMFLRRLLSREPTLRRRAEARRISTASAVCLLHVWVREYHDFGIWLTRFCQKRHDGGESQILLRYIWSIKHKMRGNRGGSTFRSRAQAIVARQHV